MRTSCSLALTSFAVAIFTASHVFGFQDPFNETPEQIRAAKLANRPSRAQDDQEQKPAAAPPRLLNIPPPGGPEPHSNGKTVRFSFNEEEWSEVIHWIAEQANFSLQPVADYPEGVFTLIDDSKYTVLEALDQLNHALRIRQPEGYTLIRNRNMLILSSLRDRENFPNDLIETVKVEDLDKRGKYETISCIFDVGELDAETIGGQIEQLVSRDNKEFFIVFPTANQIHVRETGGQLRKIRDLIQASLQKEFGDEMKLKVYHLQNLDAEAFMELARPLLGMEPGSNKRKDEKLLIPPVQPFAERLFIRGNAKWLAEFDKVAKTIDSDLEEVVSDVVLDKPYLKMYPVLVDRVLAFDTLQTMLEPRSDEVRMQQDENTGAITVLGRKDDHQLVLDTLAAISGDGSEGFALIKLLKGDPAEIIVVLQNLFRQSAADSSGPVLLANSYTKQIIVRGTPQEVELVKTMVAQLDADSAVANDGTRSQRRIISMNEREMEELAPLLPDLLMSTGRKNPFNMIMPKDRMNVQESIKKQQRGGSVDDFLRGVGAPDEKPSQSRTRVPGPRETSLINTCSPDTVADTTSTKFSEFLTLIAHTAGLNPALASSLITIQETQEQSESQGYQPPPQVRSVPGAPVFARFSNGSLILDSEDLDALDDLVYEIENRIGSTSELQRPTFYYLEYRAADEMMNKLNEFFNLAGGGGGGGDGGGGGLVEGMMSNMLGGGEDLLDSFIGGGDSGGSEGGFLEGDVRFGVDMKFNSLWVTGASESDLVQITDLIDHFDQPEAPHDPKLLGEFRTIDILHRDPVEIKEKIEYQLGDLVESGEVAAQGGGGGGNDEIARMVQQLAGGKGRGKGGGGAVMIEKKPQVRLNVDPATRQLLVSGPEFIYKEIVGMVSKLDTPEKPLDYKIITNVNNQAMIIKMLQEALGPKIIIVGDEAADSSGGGGAQASRSNNRANGSNTAADLENAIQAQVQAQQRANRNRSNRNGSNRFDRGNRNNAR